MKLDVPEERPTVEGLEDILVDQEGCQNIIRDISRQFGDFVLKAKVLQFLYALKDDLDFVEGTLQPVVFLAAQVAIVWGSDGLCLMRKAIEANRNYFEAEFRHEAIRVILENWFAEEDFPDVLNTGLMASAIVQSISSFGLNLNLSAKSTIYFLLLFKVHGPAACVPLTQSYILYRFATGKDPASIDGRLSIKEVQMMVERAQEFIRQFGLRHYSELLKTSMLNVKASLVDYDDGADVKENIDDSMEYLCSVCLEPDDFATIMDHCEQAGDGHKIRRSTNICATIGGQRIEADCFMMADSFQIGPATAELGVQVHTDQCDKFESLIAVNGQFRRSLNHLPSCGSVRIDEYFRDDGYMQSFTVTFGQEEAIPDMQFNILADLDVEGRRELLAGPNRYWPSPMFTRMLSCKSTSIRGLALNLANDDDMKDKLNEVDRSLALYHSVNWNKKECIFGGCEQRWSKHAQKRDLMLHIIGAKHLKIYTHMCAFCGVRKRSNLAKHTKRCVNRYDMDYGEDAG